MSVGFGQILVIILLFVLLFGDIPNLVNKVVSGINIIKQSFQGPKEIEQKRGSSKEIPSKRKGL